MIFERTLAVVEQTALVWNLFYDLFSYTNGKHYHKMLNFRDYCIHIDFLIMAKLILKIFKKMSSLTETFQAKKTHKCSTLQTHVYIIITSII